MKLAYSVLLPDSKVNMFAYRGDLEEALKRIKDIGYDGVELFACRPAELDINNIEKLIETTGLEVCSIGTSPAGAEDKLVLMSRSSEVRSAAVARAKEIVDFAAIFGATVNIGKFRGNLPTDNRIEGWKWLKQSMTEICEYAAKKDVMITIEPQNRMNLNNLNTTQEALLWIENMNIGNLYIISDTFHMDAEEKSITASILEAADYIKHIHIADSNRNIPGQGSIDFLEIARVLKAIRYDGYLSLEIAQGSDGLAAAERSWKYLNNIYNELV
ncbi:MAG: TIM barrel protein [Clostridia bacterium]